jgi:hypothetical protein
METFAVVTCCDTANNVALANELPCGDEGLNGLKAGKKIAVFERENTTIYYRPGKMNDTISRCQDILSDRGCDIYPAMPS